MARPALPEAQPMADVTARDGRQAELSGIEGFASILLIPRGITIQTKMEIAAKSRSHQVLHTIVEY
jgi:hypothetical protein